MGDAEPVVTVVVPAYREAHTIAATVSEIRAHLLAALGEGGFEVIVVDDGSDDETAATATAAGADRVIRHVHNLGKGAAVRTGMLAASGEHVIFTDADLAYSADHLLEVLAELRRGADVVIGSRHHPLSSFTSQPSKMRRWGSKLVNLLARMVLVGRYGDTQAGLKGFRRPAARAIFGKLEVTGMGFDVEVLQLAEQDGFRVVEIPVRLADPGRSSVRLVRDGLRLVWDVVRIARRARRDRGSRSPHVLPGRSSGVRRHSD
ncbi:MAG: hypothetical protein KatS3mg008_2085 [Acidimicrobiales bacterium]|nr:MAG: hypothetical protein KatS3mg008_2085 [Acidimicrobiales bacterium]